MSLQAGASYERPLTTAAPRGRASERERSLHQPVRIFLVADAEIVVTGVKQLLRAHRDRIKLVGSARHHENVGAAVVACRPDLVLVDGDDRGKVDLGVISRLLVEKPGLRAVVLTSYAEERQLLQAMRAGAAGYLPKSLSGAELVDQLERARNGQVVVDPSLVSRLGRVHGNGAMGGWPGAHLGLTRRESEVLLLLTDGLRGNEIAERLFVGRETVKTHLRSIYRKLKVADRAGAVALALRDGIFT